MKRFLAILLFVLLVPMYSSAGSYINAVYTDYSIYFNGSKLDGKVINVDGETYIPLKKAMELTGYNAEWDGKNVQVSKPIDIEKLKESCVMVYDYKGNTPITRASGVIVKEGILTNYHCIDQGDNVQIEYFDSTTKVKVKVLKYDKDLDLALLSNTKESKIVGLGDVSNLVITDRVYTISSPDGNKNTISTGEYKGRYPGVEVLLSSAKAMSGSSGGGLFSSAGKLIGIISNSNKDTNESSSIPIDIVKNFIN